MSNTNERVFLRQYPFLGKFKEHSMDFPITNCLPFFLQIDENFYQIIFPIFSEDVETNH